MWESIKRCFESGMSVLHFGRTSPRNEGLRRFKLGFGTTEAMAHSAKYDFRQSGFVKDRDFAEGPMNNIFRRLPGPLFRLAGSLLYPHMS
jgi:hypothetical protein